MPPINYFPNTYNPYLQPQYIPQPQAAPQPTTQISTGILWVGSEQEAQNYPVAPNNAVALWDSTTPVIYLKQTDASGRPNIKTYELKERLDPAAAPAPSNLDYAEKSELDKVRADFESFRTELKSVKKEIISLKRKHEELEDE